MTNNHNSSGRLTLVAPHLPGPAQPFNLNGPLRPSRAPALNTTFRPEATPFSVNAAFVPRKAAPLNKNFVPEAVRFSTDRPLRPQLSNFRLDVPFKPQAYPLNVQQNYCQPCYVQPSYLPQAAPLPYFYFGFNNGFSVPPVYGGLDFGGGFVGGFSFMNRQSDPWLAQAGVRF